MGDVRRKCLRDGRFLEERHAQNLQDCVETVVDGEFLSEDSYKYVEIAIQIWVFTAFSEVP